MTEKRKYYVLEGVAKVGLHWISLAVFPVCWPCNQGTSGSTVVWMFNHLPMYSKSNHLVLQKTIGRNSTVRNEDITIFYFYLFMWNILTWKLVVIAFASNIFLFNIARSSALFMRNSGLADLQCFNLGVK